jgi:phytoene dehydrogenase-like protein
MSTDVLVMGSGVDELVCAHYLARAGHRVQVLEERAREPDGEDAPGWVPPRVIRDFELERHGLAIRRPDPWVTAPLPGGGFLQLWADRARSVDAIRRLSPRDAAKWPEFIRRMVELAGLLERVYTDLPPDPVSPAAGDLSRLGGLGLRLRALGRSGVQDFLRLLPISVADWLDDWFECAELKAILAATALAHYHAGPRADGTGFRLLHHHVGCPEGVFSPAISNARSVLAKLPGVQIRSGAVVAGIAVRAGRVAGVVLAGGEEIAASLVISGAGPRRTLLELVAADGLDPEFTRAVHHIRARGVVARVRLTLEREPAHPLLHVAPSLDHLERAADDAKYGRVSREPYLQARSGGRAADGRHRVEVHLQYAPHRLAEGEWNAARGAALGELARTALSRHWPEFGGAAVERVLTPRSLEAEWDWPEGQAHQAELALDQALWMRPIPALARYRTPVGGLYLCGPGMHPGGGVAGAAGANVARVIRRGRPQSP